MGTRMEQRRGTSAEWAALNPILSDGEIGWNRTTGEIRMGDGVTAWADLPSSNIYIPKAVLDASYSPIGALPIGVINAEGDLLVGTGDNSVARLAKGTAGQRLTIDGAGNLAWVDLPSATNPFTAVDAAGDLLVGTGADAVGRLAKGANGQFLSVVGGALAWAAAPATDISGKVNKAGDTMTGQLVLAPTTTHDVLQMVAIDDTAVFTASAVGATVLSKLMLWNVDTNALLRLDAGAIYDNNNRVYSASNPPPASGMTVLGAALFTVSPSGGNVWNSTGITFTAPATGKIKVYTKGRGASGTTINVNLSAGVPGSLIGTSMSGDTGVVGFTGLTPGASYTLYAMCANQAQPADFLVEG